MHMIAEETAANPNCIGCISTVEILAINSMWSGMLQDIGGADVMVMCVSYRMDFIKRAPDDDGCGMIIALLR